MKKFLLLLLLMASCKTIMPADLVPALPKASLKAVLGQGDVIEVRVFDELELSGIHQISTGGTVRLPLVGEQKIIELTPEEAAGKIAKSYEEKYLKRAEVSVFVKEFNSRKVYVLGEVRNPGPYPFEENMTVIAAVARAGGTTMLASPNRTVITREIEGQTTRISAKVGDIGRGEQKDIELHPGDIVFIPESIF